MKKSVCALMLSVLALAATGQVSSTNGNFTATTPSNLSLQTQAGTVTSTRLTILSATSGSRLAGFVGLNTPTPDDWFHVNGNIRANQFNSVSGVLNTIGATNLSFRTNNAARMTILGATSGSRLAGFVGLNTPTPDDWFHVNGDIRANQFNSVSGVLNTIGATDLSFRTNNTARMTIGSNGLVGIGIGTASLANQLQIGPNPQGFGGNDFVATNGNGGLAINTSGTDTYLWGSTDISIRPGNTGNPSIYAKSDGTVGIGTSSPNPAYKLDVAGTINATSILVNGQPISSGSSVWTNTGTDINFLTGSVGIGKAPAAGNKLDVEGNVNSTGIFLNSNPGLGDPTFTTRSAGTKFVLSSSLTSAAADYAFGTSANTLWSSVNTTSSSFKWFGGITLAATLTGGGNLTLGSGGSGSVKARNVIPSSINLTGVGATTTLTAASHYYQNSTVAQTIRLPVVTTLSNGHQFFIKNSSTQPVTVQTSAGTAVQVMAANATLELTCINTGGGTGTASWQWVYNTNTAGSPATSQWTTTGTSITYGAGNIGIGTFATTPAERLSIRQAAVAFALTDINITNTNYNTLKIWGNSQNVFGMGVGAETKSAFNPQLLFNGLDNSVLIPSAKFGVGTNTPSANVHLVSPSSSNPIDALKIEVASFSNSDNAANSSYFSVRDIGANSTPFIIKGTGFVGIGTSSPDQMLTVNGQIHAKDVLVDANVPAPDYVFEKEYNLLPLDSIKNYIDQNKHLPEVPSANEFKKNGVNLGDMNMTLLKKIEELTLYVIQQQKEIEELRKKVDGKK